MQQVEKFLLFWGEPAVGYWPRNFKTICLKLLNGISFFNLKRVKGETQKAKY
jgi:hypothetical protein